MTARSPTVAPFLVAFGVLNREQSLAQAKAFAGTLKTLGIDGSALFVDATIEKNLALASRNIPNLVVTTADRLNTYQVLRPNKLVITRGALDKLGARLKA